TGRYETPHTRWAKPYAGGRIKVTYFIGSPFQGMGTHAREAVEFMQRFDVEVEAVFYYHFYRKDWFGGVAGHRRLDRLMREQTRDVFVFQDVTPKLLETCWMGKGAVNAFRPAVENGTGVVLIGADDGALLAGRQKLEKLPDWLGSGPALEAATLQKGRIVRMPARPKVPYKVGWRLDYENWQYELGRAVLWAARREPDCILNYRTMRENRGDTEVGEKKAVKEDLERNTLPGEALHFTWQNLNSEDNPEIHLTLRRWDGAAQHLSHVDCRSDKGTAPIKLPKLRAGDYRIDAIVRSKRGIENFASYPIQVTASSAIRDLKLSSEWAEVGDNFSAEISITANEDQTLRVKLVDRQGRVLVREDRPTKTGQAVHPFRFRVESWMP
ncbi:MAG: hypothetical protein QF886_25730, partial [Planctomycetota bacterium]|nr:hypothetical protein [Planctomycetota bacterium]